MLVSMKTLREMSVHLCTQYLLLASIKEFYSVPVKRNNHVPRGNKLTPDSILSFLRELH